MLKPDLRPRRITAAELFEDAEAERAEMFRPTIRFRRDSLGTVVEIDGVPVRRRAEYADERTEACWSTDLTDYRWVGDK